MFVRCFFLSLCGVRHYDLTLQFLLCCFWFVIFLIELLLIRCFYAIFFTVLFLLQCARFATDSLFWFGLNAFRTNYFLTIRLFLVFFHMYSYFLDHFATLFSLFFAGVVSMLLLLFLCTNVPHVLLFFCLCDYQYHTCLVV